MPAPRRLLPDGGDWHGRHASWDSVQELVAHLEGRWLPPAPPEDVWYAWQPLPLIDFLEGMTTVRDHLGRGRHSFLDVGSGIGSKLLVADRLGFEAGGLERHEPYAIASRQLYPDLAVTLAEAQDYDGYGRFDVIYCYRLAIDAALQTALNRHIAAQMSPGQLFFSAGGPYPDWLEHVNGQVWRR